MLKDRLKKEYEDIKEFLRDIAKPLALQIIFFISAPYVVPTFIRKYSLEIPYIILYVVLLWYTAKCALLDKSKNKVSEK